MFCAVLTHDASTKNGFTECKDDTVNTNGKGTYDEEHKLHGQVGNLARGGSCWRGLTCEDSWYGNNAIDHVLSKLARR